METAIPIQPTTRSKASGRLAPMPLWQSLLIFGIPGAVIYLLIHFVVPPLSVAGVPLIVSWTASVVGPTVLAAVIVLLVYFRQPGTNWQTFQVRFRFQPLQRRDWLLIPGALVLILALNSALAPTIPLLQQIPFFTPPVMPELFANAYETTSTGGANSTFMGVPLEARHWWLLLYWPLWYLAALAEEIVWRGYCLPRQIARHGRWAWLVNGTLWNIPFHAYVAFNFFSDMPLYFLLPLLVQWRGNTWVGVIVHVLLVSLVYVILIPGLLG